MMKHVERCRNMYIINPNTIWKKTNTLSSICLACGLSNEYLWQLNFEHADRPLGLSDWTWSPGYTGGEIDGKCIQQV